jgi:putative transposase
VSLLDRPPQDLTLVRQVALLGLNRASLYYQPAPPAAADLALKRRIDEIYTAHPFYGVRRITAQLHAEGQVVNHKAVTRQMRVLGLTAIYPGPNLSKRAHDAAIHPYLLRGVRASAPNHVWGVDITYIRITGAWLYLVAFLDWHSRYIVSWELDQSLAVGFVLTALERALAQATPTICNSDQGSQFTSPQYTGVLTTAGVAISMDGRGRALDNIFTERLWRTIKYEDVYLHEYTSPRQAREQLSGYIQFYNHARLHQALGYRTPASVYKTLPLAAAPLA